MKVTKRSKIFLIFGLIAVLVLTALLVVGLCERAQTPAYAQTEAVAAGIAIGLAAAAGAIGMGIAISKTNESIARQPEAEGKLRSTFMLGLIFIETAIIYALVVAILIIFVL